MLWTPTNEFNWSTDNYGATYTDTGIGANSPGHANANTKGANTNMLNGVAEDVYGISILFCGQNASATIRRCMVDLLVDPAAGVGNPGSSWSVAIANLYANSPTLGVSGNFGWWYYFPLYLAAGTAIGTAHQNLVAGTLPLQVAIRVFGKPSRPELVKVGTRVQTIGATVGTTTGVAVTPGTSALGSYSATLGTLTNDSFFFQLGVGSADTTMTARGYQFDIAVNATNKVLVAENILYSVCGSVEQASKSAIGSSPPIQRIASGQDVYVRGAAQGGAPDSSMTAIVYAVAG